MALSSPSSPPAPLGATSAQPDAAAGQPSGQPQGSSPEDTDGLPAPRRYLAVASLLGGIGLTVLDGAIANVALPTITEHLQGTPSDAVWIVTAYQLAVVMFLLPAAAVGERLGYRRVFMSGVALFTLASAACALAPSLGWLIAARCLQGLGSAAVMPLALALLRFTYPKHLLGRAIGWNALAVAGASAAGPTVGAALLSVASWPWLFAVNIPAGLLVLAAATRLPAVRGVARRIDPWSVGLNAGGFAALILGCDWVLFRPVQGGLMLAVAALAFLFLIRRELPRAAPMIPLDLLRSHSFRISVIASVCCFSGQMASYVALPFYFQHALGQDTLATGLLMTPWPLAVMLAAPLSGRLAERVPTAWMCAAGGLCLAAGLALCAAWPIQADMRWPMALSTALAGLGFGFFQTPNNRNMLLSAPKERSGAAGGAQGMARLTGQTLGGLLMGLLFAFQPTHLAPLWGLYTAAALAAAAGLISLLRSPGRGQRS